MNLNDFKGLFWNVVFGFMVYFFEVVNLKFI